MDDIAIELKNGKPYTFTDCCIDLINNKEFIYHFNRLTDAKIDVTSVEAMEDSRKYFPALFDFVYEYIWSRLPDEAFESANKGD